MSDELFRAIGALEGRQGALESRMGRHEDDVRNSLELINKKQDGISVQLADISTQLAEIKAEKRGGASIIHWIMTLAGIAVAWFAGSHIPPGGAH